MKKKNIKLLQLNKKLIERLIPNYQHHIILGGNDDDDDDDDTGGLLPLIIQL